MSKITCEEIAAQLGGGKEKRNGDGSWNTRCPAHNDDGPSLSVSEKNGKILVRCHAGCTQEAVINALRDRGLWPKITKTWTAKPHAPKGSTPPSNMEHPKYGKAKNSWVYRNRQGLIAGVICRFDYLDDGKLRKEILPMTWCMSEEGEHRWWWKQMPEPRCLYNEHRLEEHKPIILTEGEKACDAAQKIVGDAYLCMTWPGGSKAVKRANWKQLKNRDIIIWPDADEPGDMAARWLAEILIEEGARSVRRVMLPEGLPEGWDLADEMPAGFNFDPLTIIRTAPEYKPQGDSVIEKFNREFALVMIGGQAVVLQEERNTAEGRVDLKYLSITAFKEFYGNRQVIQGKQQIPESTYWIKHEERRSYTSVIFEPNNPSKTAYNLWRGFSVEADPTGDWSLLQDHIEQNLAKGDLSLAHWILGWFAHIIQYPDHKVGTSLAFRGRQGTGKTIIGKAMGQLYRPHYVLVEDSRYVLGNFNSHMASTLLLHADEAFFAGDPRHVGRLRGMVTSDTHRIEMKGKDSFEVNNYMRLLVTSNNDFIMPAAFEERRFAVLDAGEGRIQDKPYFKALWKQLQNGGFGGLLHYLQTFDLSSVDIGVIPSTAALQEQKLYSLDGVMRFWFERLWQGQALPHLDKDMWPDFVAIEDLYDAYLKRSEAWGERRRVDIPTFGKELKKIWPGVVLNKKHVSIKRMDRYGTLSDQMVWAYKLDHLSVHRKVFSDVCGEVDWPAEGEDTPELPKFKETKTTLLDDDVPF